MLITLVFCLTTYTSVLQNFPLCQQLNQPSRIFDENITHSQQKIFSLRRSRVFTSWYFCFKKKENFTYLNLAYREHFFISVVKFSLNRIVKMKLILFIIAAFVVAGTSAQNSNVTAEFQNIQNEIEANISSFIDYFDVNIQGAIDAARSLLQVAVNALNALLTFTANLVSPSFANMVQNGLSAVVDSLITDLNSNSLRNSTSQYFRTVRDVYRSRIEKYYAAYNSSGIYQCWNVSRPQIRQVWRDFLNTTATQIRPYLTDFRNLSDTQYKKAESVFIQAQRNAPACFFFLQPQKSRNCREAYVSEISRSDKSVFKNYF